jgi:protein O-GlcNAc transferase
VNDLASISIVVVVHRDEYYQRSRGCLDRLGVSDVVEVRGAKSLFAAYDEGWAKARHDLVCFLHEDAEIEGVDEALIHEKLSDPTTGFLGVAGARILGETGVWWSGFGTQLQGDRLSGRCGHFRQGRREVTDYGPFGEVVALDGVLLITTKAVLQTIGGFADPPLDGFDFYDVSPTFRARLRGYRNYTIPMSVFHWGGTQMRPSWEHNRRLFVAKYRRHLPFALDGKGLQARQLPVVPRGSIEPAQYGAARPTAPPIEVTASRHFLSWLNETGVSLAFTTYQTNRLFLIGLKDRQRLSIFERHFDRPMGLYATADRLYMSSRWQLWELIDSLPAGEHHEGYDRLYVPRRAHTTGDLDIHDIALDGRGRIVFVSTLYGCLATVSERYSFTPLWKPPFISRLAPEDRCHLNGLAMADGEPAYVTAVSRSDVAAGWRERRESGGCVIDVEDGEIVAGDLSMPHSPRVYRERLWVLNSGTGELGYVDRTRGRFEPIAFCPGFLRGLAFCGDYAIVGLSKQRQERTFAGLPLDDRLREKDAEARCGLWVVDLRSGNTVHWLQLEGVVIELYDVAVIPGARRPMALGFQTDEIQRLLTIDGAPQPRLEVLLATEPAPTSVAAAGGREPLASPSPRTAAGVPAAATEAARAAYQRGNQLAKAGRFSEAAEQYMEAVELDPAHVNARINLGTALHRLGKVEAAIARYREALAIDPRCVRAHANLASLLRDQGDLDAAIGHYETAAQVEPGNADVLHELGMLLPAAGRLDEAKARLQQIVDMDPRSARALNSFGAVLVMEQSHAEAQPFFERAAELQPDLFEAHLNLGNVFEALGEVTKARDTYQRALSVRDAPVLALHRELLCPPVFGSVEELDSYRARAESVIDSFTGRDLSLVPSQVQSSRAEAPFDWAYHGRDNRSLKRRYAALFEGAFHFEPLGHRPQSGGPWHVGFVVTSTHEGVFLRCMAGVVDGLDRRRFRITIAATRGGLALIRRSLRNRDVNLLELPLRFDQAVERLRTARLDLAYFWEVGTDATNYFLPFCRVAPVQCTGWGWPDTSGIPELDCHLSSEALCGPEADGFFSETLVRLPQLPAYCHRPPLQLRPQPPEHFGLPEGAHLYLCVQNLRKAHPEMDPLIGRILRADRRGVVGFVHDKSPVYGDLLDQRWRETLADVRDRLVLLPRRESDQYVHLLASANVVLDTVYFSGSNTAYDALLAGVPSVTLPLGPPRGRYTAALYRSIGVEDCIADSADRYVELAVRLGTDPELRARLCGRIREAAPRAFENRAAVSQLEDFFAAALRKAARS